jgi:hypothetical protein
MHYTIAILNKHDKSSLTRRDGQIQTIAILYNYAVSTYRIDRVHIH